MRFKTGVCTQCGKEGEFGKPSLSLCHYCNKARLSLSRPKPGFLGSSQSGLRTRKIRPRIKPTGEAVLFKAIWESREHRCGNCKAHLGNEARTFFFAHILPKSTHPERRLDALNIQLLCLECHSAYDQGSKESYLKRSIEL